MEFELGLKITKNVDDTCTDFRLAKDQDGSLFVSSETQSKFILTARLRGYRWESIKIDISDDATVIISGEKPVQEMLMNGFRMYKKEIEVKRFTKVFQIPDGVILDRVEAKFNEIESILTISMPKLIKGIFGGDIREIKEKQTSTSNNTTTTNTTTTNNNNNNNNNEIEKEMQNCDGREEEHCEGEAEKNEIKDERTISDQDQNESEGMDNKCSRLFSPCFLMGGAFIVSLVVFVCSCVKLRRR